jgi:hypothetical protein
MGHWLSVSITSEFYQDLDKEIGAAQKKAEEEKVNRDAEKRKGRRKS